MVDSLRNIPTEELPELSADDLVDEDEITELSADDLVEEPEEIASSDLLQEEGEPTVKRIEIESRVSKDHPGRNEDAALGDHFRLRDELANPPKLNTGDTAGDLAVMRSATERELKMAAKLKSKDVFGVLDGVSGISEGTGAVASRLASAAIAERLSELPDYATVDETKTAMREALGAADAEIKRYKESGAARGRKEEMSQTGTTASLAKLIENADGTTEAVIGSVGDSRVYKFDGATKKLIPLTMDENMVGLMVRQKSLTRGEYDAVMSAEDPDSLPAALTEKITALMKRAAPTKPGAERTVAQDVKLAMRGMYNSLSGDTALTVGENGNVFSVKLKKGDKLLLSTDGLHDQRTDAQIEAHLAAGGSIESLTAAAYESDRKPDDITAKLIEIGGGVARPEIAKAERNTQARVRDDTMLAATSHHLDEIYRNPLDAPPVPARKERRPPSVSGVFNKLLGRFAGDDEKTG